MSARLNGAKRTGRAEAVRAYLRKQRQSKSAREILDAIEPGGNITLMCATLATLHGSDAVLREGTGQGNVRWKIAPAKAKATRGAKLKRAAAKHAHVKTPRTAPKPQPTASLVAAVKPAPKPAALPSTREQRTNFVAPLATVERPRSSTNGRESIPEFLQRGGVIQLLAPHECSQPLKATIAATHADMRPARKHKSPAANGA